MKIRNSVIVTEDFNSFFKRLTGWVALSVFAVLICDCTRNRREGVAKQKA